MDTTREDSPADGQGMVCIADVRNVPLDQLNADAGASQLVNIAMRSVKGPSRVSVAAFGSAI